MRAADAPAIDWPLLERIATAVARRRTWARHGVVRRVDHEDLRAVALASAWRAWTTWDGRGVRRAWTIRQADRAAVNWCRSYGPVSRGGTRRTADALAQSLDAPLSAATRATLHDVLSDPGAPPADADLCARDEHAHRRRTLRALLPALRPRQRDLLRAALGRVPASETAARLGTSAPSVHAMQSQSRARLRALLARHPHLTGASRPT